MVSSLVLSIVLIGTSKALFGMSSAVEYLAKTVVLSVSFVAEALKIVTLLQMSLKNLRQKSSWLISSSEVLRLIITRSPPARNWTVSAKQLSDWLKKMAIQLKISPITIWVGSHH